MLLSSCLICTLTHTDLLKCYQACRGYRAAYSAMKNAVNHIKIPVQQLYVCLCTLSPSLNFSSFSSSSSLSSPPSSLHSTPSSSLSSSFSPLSLLPHLSTARGSSAGNQAGSNSKGQSPLVTMALYVLAASKGSCWWIILQARACLEKAVKLDWTFEKASLLLSQCYRKEKAYGKATDMWACPLDLSIFLISDCLSIYVFVCPFTFLGCLLVCLCCLSLFTATLNNDPCFHGI